MYDSIWDVYIHEKSVLIINRVYEHIQITILFSSSPLYFEWNKKNGVRSLVRPKQKKLHIHFSLRIQNNVINKNSDIKREVLFY